MLFCFGIRSNKKTIRILTEEILKIKRTAVVYPTESDEFLAFRSMYRNSSDTTTTTSSSSVKSAEMHPKPFNRE